MRAPRGMGRRTRYSAVALLAAAGALISAPLAVAQEVESTPEEKGAALVMPAVVQLEMTWSGWVADEDELFFNDSNPYTVTSTCTGFVVNPDGYIVTAGHCVDNGSGEGGIGQTFIQMAAEEAAARGIYTTSDPAELYEFGLLNWRPEGTNTNSPPDLSMTVTRAVAASGEQFADPVAARVVDYQPLAEGDVALVKIEEEGLPTLQLSDSDLAIGTPVLSVGFPGSTAEVTDPSLEPTFKAGQISAERTVAGNPFAETSAALTGGMSGGPTVDREGRVIGVNSFGPGGEPQAFNYVAVGSSLEGLLGRNGVDNEPGPVDVAYRAGLDAYYSGNNNEALAQFDRVLDVAASHEQAQEYRRLAIERGGVEGAAAPPVAPAGDDSGMSTTTMILIGAGAAVVLIAAGTTVLLVRRRQRGPAPVPSGQAMPYSQSGMTYQPGEGTPQSYLPEPGPAVPVPRSEWPLPSAAQDAAGTTILDTSRSTCGACGHPRTAGDRFCPGCGATLS